ncbi:hypothetical protein PG996_003146 [Apiospora saccharicola]|uniref:Trichothecene 3-O-acetyltransferase n=1 Tax=Apiospora saccharicola TaxID=335842 RepID=A0ABR1W0F0_9PEZI
MEAKEIRVRPLGESPESNRFELSDMDHTMPKIYVQIAEIFELPPDVDRDGIVQSLTEGLAFALGQYPVLAGVLRMDASNGRMWVTKKQDSTVGLFVNDASAPAEKEHLPSFEYLEANDFPVQLLDGHKVLPKIVTEKQLFSPLGENADDDATIISTFQITFIEGGLILAAAIHHNCSDGPGCNGFLTTWAENSAAASRGEPFKPIDVANAARDQLSAPKPSAERWKELDGKFPILKNLGAPAPAPPPDFVMPNLKIRIWHVPISRAAELKAACAQADKEKWVSTYDCIMALFWKTITRAKLPLLQPAVDKEVLLVHAVNTRNMLQPPLPDRFLGNAVALPRVPIGSIEELVRPEGESNLPQLAAAVRESIRTITPQYAAELPEWVAGLEDRRYIAIDMDSFLGMDLAGTSWQAMTPYERHDFGFGLPKAMRWPHPQFEGYVFVLPSRAAVKKTKNSNGVAGRSEDENDEGLEICVCLEESCHDRLLRDAELLKFAQPRGLDA